MAGEDKTVDSNAGDSVQNGQDNINEANKTDGENGIGEFKEKLAKLDSKISNQANENKELKDKLEKLQAEKSLTELEKKSEAEQLKTYREEAETFRKKDKWRAICADKGLNSEDFINTALRMDINELDNYAASIKDSIEKSTTSATEQARKDFEAKIPTNQPKGDSINNNEPDTDLSNFARGAGIK
jgi:hypothetical protein